MTVFDLSAAALTEDSRHARPATPWELFHEASKLTAAEFAHSKLALKDRILRAEEIRGERRMNRVSARAPKASSFFHNRPRVLLPLPDGVESGVAKATWTRRSTAHFGEESISFDDLAFLLECAALPTHSHPVSGAPLRATPASGGLYELEIYLAVQRVRGLAPGLYHYHANSHSLARLPHAEGVTPLAETAAVPELVESAALCFLLVSVIGRLEWKYGQRGYRFTLVNAGHMGQQLCLAAAERGLSSCPHGGFLDDEVSSYLGIDGVTEFLAHSVAIGRPAARAVARSAAVSRPRLRRFDFLALPTHYADWRALEGLAAEWVGAPRRRDEIAAREAALHLRALLPGDRTLCEYVRCDRDPKVALEWGDDAVFAFPGDWSEVRRGRWRASAALAAGEVRRWLEVEAIPRVFLDLVHAGTTPRTDNRLRWLHRRVTLPNSFRLHADPDSAVLAHEFAHAAYLPHNTFIAEGVAAAVGWASRDSAEVVRELRARRALPPLEDWILSPRTPDLEGHLHSAVAASFVAFLCARFGRDRFFKWTDGFLYPAPASERRAIRSSFAAVFGEALGVAIRRWGAV